jgi:hypothetical protein
MINARGGTTENRRRGRHTTVDLVQCSRHFGNFLIKQNKTKRRTTQVEEKKGPTGRCQSRMDNTGKKIELLLLL